MFLGKIFKINLLLNIVDTKEINLILWWKVLEYKGLVQLLKCYKQEIQGQPLVLTFMDLWDVAVGSNLWMWSSPPALSSGSPGLCPDGFWIFPRMGTSGFLGKLCFYLVTQFCFHAIWNALFCAPFPVVMLFMHVEIPPNLFFSRLISLSFCLFQMFQSLQHLCSCLLGLVQHVLVSSVAGSCLFSSWVQQSRCVSALLSQARLTSPHLLAVLIRMQARFLLGIFSSS